MKEHFNKAYQIVFIVLFVLVMLTIVFYGDISTFFENIGISKNESIESTEGVSAAAVQTDSAENDKSASCFEAMFYEALDDLNVQCHMCFRNCVISEGERGFCESRENIRGKLYALTYGKPVAVHIDPVEKIPFSHFYPGTDALAIGTATCSLRCLNCINWQLAWKAPEEVEQFNMTPEEVVETAKKNDLKTICFTYNEPTNCYEYMLAVFRIAKKEGMRTVFHTSGVMNSAPFDELSPYVDAVVVDLKGFSEEFYEENCSGELQPVLDFLVHVKEHGIWLEVVNLIIPGKNDNTDTIQKMCEWYVENLGPDVPLQFSRFFPTNSLSNLAPTPVETIENACEVANKAGIRFVYVGNISGNVRINTYCPECGELLIERVGLSIRTFSIVNGKCMNCGCDIPGMWNLEEGED